MVGERLAAERRLDRRQVEVLGDCLLSAEETVRPGELVLDLFAGFFLARGAHMPTAAWFTAGATQG